VSLVWTLCRIAGNLPIQEKNWKKPGSRRNRCESAWAEVSKAEAKLREAEGGSSSTKTSAMASAELQDLLKAAHSSNKRSMSDRCEFLPVKAMGTDYTQVPLGVQFQCHVDQLGDLLKAIGDSPKSLTVARLTSSRWRVKKKY